MAERRAVALTDTPLVSVVVPTRDKAPSLRLTLACLAAQRCPLPFEVVVTDDGAVDDTREVAQQAAAAGLRLRLVTGGGNGRAAARNAGAAAARGQLLVFLDDDILIPPSSVAAHCAAHGLLGADSGMPAALPLGENAAPERPWCVHGPLRELPGAGGLLRAAVPDHPHELAAAGTYGRTVANALERMVEAMATGTVAPVAPWLACIGANTSLPSRMWRQSGGYDEEFGTTWGCEDLELGYRLHRDGTTMALAPAASGIHLTHARPDRWEQHTLNLERFIAKHPDPAIRALPSLLGPSGSVSRYLSHRSLESQ